MITLNLLHSMAKQLHFCNLGILEARIFQELRPVLEKRVDEQRVTAFEEQQIELRINPFLILEDAKSIVVTATSYHTDVEFHGEDKLAFSGKLARFSWGLDYHQVLHRQLASLAEKLSLTAPGLQWKAYVDTGPLVDRYLAAQAGMGVYGKNNCFIIPGVGSYVVLGYLVINQPITESVAKPQTLVSCSGCGTCQRACPTNALETPYQINPRRCLSHLLQQKEFIPHPLRGLVGTRLYGCDVCQEACPHNREIPVSTEPNMVHLDRGPWLDLPHLLSLSNREFNRLYRNRAFGWRGQKIMQRNALMALGNTKDPKAVKLIEPFLVHPREELSDMAKWAFKQHQTP